MIETNLYLRIIHCPCTYLALYCTVLYCTMPCCSLMLSLTDSMLEQCTSRISLQHLLSCIDSRVSTFIGFQTYSPLPSLYPLKGMLSVKSWFQRYVQGPMRSNGISLSLRTVKLNNTLKKPGPVFLGE